MARYFMSHRATKPVSINGRNYSFTPTTIAGNMVFGVFEATTAEQIADLAQAVALGGLEEIPKEDYEAEKKRTQLSDSKKSSPLNPAPLPKPSPSIDSASRASPEVAKPVDPEQGVRIVSLNKVLRVGRVNSPGFVKETERLNT